MSLSKVSTKTILRVVQGGKTTDYDSYNAFSEAYGPGTQGLKDSTIQMIEGDDKQQFYENILSDFYVCYQQEGSKYITCYDPKMLFLYGPKEPQQVLFYGTVKQCSDWKNYMEKITIPQIIGSVFLIPVTYPIVLWIAMVSGKRFFESVYEMSLVNAYKEMIEEYKLTKPELPY